MKIDVFCHVMPERYKQRLYRYADKFPTEKAVQDRRPVLTHNEERFTKLQPYTDMVQVITTTMPPIEEIVDPKEAVELAQLCNDEMAELVAKYPDKYIAAIANLPLNDMDAAIKEAERAIKELNFKGIQIYSRVNGLSPATEDMLPLYELMVGYDLPILIHPMRGSEQPDYANENVSYNQLFSIFGWPYDTTAAMVRLVFSGIFEKFPTIKFITHHFGGMVPFFADRAFAHWNNGLQRIGSDVFPGLKKHPVDYLKMFYADTAVNGNSNYTMECGLAFFGEDNVLFASDMPYDVENGALCIKTALEGIEKMNISAETKEKIFSGNACRLFHIDI